MVESIDRAIGRIEAAEALDGAACATGKAISRTTQVVGRPAKAVGNALHGRPYGHPVHPLVVAVPIGTWTLALPGPPTSRSWPGRPARWPPSAPGWPTGST